MYNKKAFQSKDNQGPGVCSNLKKDYFGFYLWQRLQNWSYNFSENLPIWLNRKATLSSNIERDCGFHSVLSHFLEIPLVKVVKFELTYVYCSEVLNKVHAIKHVSRSTHENKLFDFLWIILLNPWRKLCNNCHTIQWFRDFRKKKIAEQIKVEVQISDVL